MYKVGAEDEGTRAICNYMEKVKKVEVLDLLNNDITTLGKNDKKTLKKPINLRTKAANSSAKLYILPHKSL